MKVILTDSMAYELYHNEDLIRNEQGPYRPQFRYATHRYESVIKNWPLEPCDGTSIRVRDVISGMESEVDDIAMCKIENGKISYDSRLGWENDKEMKKYSIMIYTPSFNETTYFLTSDSLPDLFAQLKTYNIGKKDDTSNIVMSDGVGQLLDRMFEMYVTGICTYIFFIDDEPVRFGKWAGKTGY